MKFVVLSSKMSARNKTAVLVTPATRVLEFGTKLFCVEGTLLMCKVCNLLQCQCISGLTLRTILETFVFFLQSLFNVYCLVFSYLLLRNKNKKQTTSAQCFTHLFLNKNIMISCSSAFNIHLHSIFCTSQ